MAQVVHDLPELLDGFVSPGHLGEGERLLGVMDAAGPRPTKAPEGVDVANRQEQDHEDVSEDQHWQHGAHRPDHALERLRLDGSGDRGRLQGLGQAGEQRLVAAGEVDPVPLAGAVGAHDAVVG